MTKHKPVINGESSVSEKKCACNLCPGDRRRTLYKILLFFKEKPPRERVEKWCICSNCMIYIKRCPRPFRIIGKTTWSE